MESYKRNARGRRAWRTVCHPEKAFYLAAIQVRVGGKGRGSLCKAESWPSRASLRKQS